MKAAIVVFPASNCDRDVAVALTQISGTAPAMVWHQETELPPADLIVLPGGFSYGDYLRSGAMAAQSPIIRAVKARAEAGVPVLGICNGFQVLTEMGLLPGALMRNSGLHFVCKPIGLSVENAETLFTGEYQECEAITLPVAHHDGKYTADEDTLDELEDEDRVVFRYRENPNGSDRNIAGIMNAKGNVLGLMPHPERAVDAAHGGTHGVPFFRGIVEAVR